MRKRTIFRAILAVALLLTLVGQYIGVSGPWSAHAAHPDTTCPVPGTAGQMNVCPNFGVPGTSVQIVIAPGTFSSGASVSITFADSGFNNSTLVTGSAASDGSFSTSTTIPTNATGGTGKIGATSNPAPLVAVQSFLFGVQAQISVTPTQVTAGQSATLTVNGSGFGKSVTVGFSVNGSTIVGATATTGTTGSFTGAQLNITVPNTTSPLTVAATDGTNSASFTVSVSGTAPTLTFTATATATGSITPIPTGLTISPSTQQPGKIVTITAPSGTFPVNQTNILLVFYDPLPQNGTTNLATTATADASGALNIQVTLPAQASRGNATIKAFYGNNTTGPAGVVVIVPILAANPTTAAPGSTVTLTGDGYTPNTTITFTLSNVSITATNAPVVTNTFGHFVATLLIPAATVPGQAFILAADGTFFGQAGVTITITGATVTPTVSLTPTVTNTPFGFVPSPTPTNTTPPSSVVTSAYFAEGYTGTSAVNGKATFTEVFNILNPNPSAASVAITYYVHGALPETFNRSISANAILRELVNNDVGPDKFVAAVLTSSQHLVISRTMTRISAAGQRLDGSTTLPVSAPATTWDFPEGYTGITFQEYLTILNPSTTTAANVSVVLAPQADSSVGAHTLSFTVSPGDRSTANIRSLNLGNNDRSVGMIITSNVPIVAERVLYFGDGVGSGKFGSTVAHGFVTPGTQLRIAYASSGGSAPDATGKPQPVGDQDYVTILNPNTAGAAIQVTANFANGAGQNIGTPVTVSVAAGTRRTIVANTALGPGAVSPFSISLTASGPIMAESAQYYGGSPNTGLHPGVDFPAFQQATTDVFLSDLAVQSADNAAINRTVYLYNPNATPVQISALYYGASGPTAQNLYTVPGGGITAVNVNRDTQGSIPSGPIGAEFKLAPGGTGSFVAYAVGVTIDNLSATEDVGNPPT